MCVCVCVCELGFNKRSMKEERSGYEIFSLVEGCILYLKQMEK